MIGRTRTAAGEDGSKWQGVHVAVVSWCNTGLEVELVYKFRLQNPNLAEPKLQPNKYEFLLGSCLAMRKVLVSFGQHPLQPCLALVLESTKASDAELPGSMDGEQWC